MNVSKENIDNLNARIKVQVVREDYAEKVEKVLRDYRRKASIDGFRPGKVPFGLISKLYGKPVLVDEINKLVGESIGTFIETEKLQILGEPLPSEELNSEIDWDHQENFDFTFDIGLSPEFTVEVNAKLKIPFYTIRVDKEMIDKSVEDIARRNGKFTDTDIVEADEMLKGNFHALDDAGQPVEGGIAADDVVLSVKAIKDEEIMKAFAGKKVGDSLSFNLKKAFPLDTDRIGLLRLDKKEAHKSEGDFSFLVKEIKKFGNAEINQELFDAVYGKDSVKDEEEFRQKVAADIEKSLLVESEYRFSIDARKMLLSATKIDLPTAFLKRWMLHANEGKVTEEQVEKEFDHFEEDLRWQLIMGRISSGHQITLNEEDLKSYAIELVRKQFERYGMSSMTDEQLTPYAVDLLKKPEERRQLSERKLEEKIITFVRETAKLDNKSVTPDEFNKLFE